MKQKTLGLFIILLIIIGGVFFIAKYSQAGYTCPSGPFSTSIRVSGTFVGTFVPNSCGFSDQCLPGIHIAIEEIVWPVSDAAYIFDNNGTYNAMSRPAQWDETVMGQSSDCTAGPCVSTMWGYSFDTGNISISSLTNGNHTIKICSKSNNTWLCAQDCAFTKSAPTVNLKVRPASTGNYSDGPITINYNTGIDLQWAVTNSSTCTASANPANSNWTGSKSTSGGTQTINNLTQTTTFSITCTESGGGSATDSVVVNVSPATCPVVLTATPASGTAPLNNVDLTADISGTAIGTIVYKFDCTNDGTWEHTSATVSTDPYTIVDLCSYATAATYTAKAQVTRGSCTSTDTVSIAVGTAAFDFSISASPLSGSTYRGGSTTSTITVTRTAGTAAAVSFSVTLPSPFPPNITYSFSPTSCTPSSGTCTSVMTVSVNPSAYTGSMNMTIAGTAGAVVRTVVYNITVYNRAPNTPTLVSPANNSCVAANPTFQATVSDPDTADYIHAYFSINSFGVGAGASVSSGTVSSWGPVTMNDGNWWWQAWAEDTLIATSSETTYWYFTKDTIAPIASISSPEGTITTTAINVTLTESDALSGIAEGDVDVSINGAGWVNTGLPGGGSTISNFTYTGTVGNTYQFRYRARDNCGNWSAYKTDDPLTIFNFSLAVSPTSGSVSQGSSTTTTVTATLLAGATQTVAFSRTAPNPLPTGMTISFSPASCNPTCNSTMTINTTSSTPAGAYTITITGTAGEGAVRTTNYTLTVGAAFNFSMSVSPTSGSVTQGGSVAPVATATLSSGTTQAVTFSASSSPALTGGSFSFSPVSCNPTCSSTMTINTASSTPTGTYTITITGTAGSLTRTTTYTLTVGTAFNFSMSVSPTSGSVTQGGSVAPVATATLSSGTTQAVTFSASSSPALTGGSISFSPVSCNPTCSSTMTINTAGSTPAGTYIITITGTGGSLTRTTTYTLTVNAATLSVSLSANPSSGNAPLNDVDLTATLGGTAIGTINYTFYCNRSDTGNNITAGYAFKIDGRNADGTGGTVIYWGVATSYTGGTTFLVRDVCDYATDGTYSAKVIAERGGLAAEFRTTVTVSAAFNFSMSVSPTSGSVTQGGSVAPVATATLSSGTTQAVTFSASSSPALTGGSINFSVASCNPTCNSTMTVTTAASTPSGVYTITITGTGGSLTRTTTYTLTVGAETLSVNLTANKTSGPAPLTGVNLTAALGGTALGTINYTFYCNKPVMSGSPPGLVGYWNLDEGSGTTAQDTSGSGNNGTLINGPVWTTGRNGGALDFDGVNDNVDMGDPANGSLDMGTSDFTVSAWVYVDALPATPAATEWRPIVAKYATPGWAIFLQTNTSGVHKWMFYANDTGSKSVSSNNPVVAGQWYHVLGRVSSGILNLFVDGAQQTATNTRTGTIDNTTTFHIGGAYGSKYLDAKIDDVRIFNRALTPAEILDVYNFTGGATSDYDFKIDARNPDGTGGTVIYQGTATSWSGGTTFTVNDACSSVYNSPGTYTARVIAERGSLSAQDTETITVSSAFNFSMSVSPTSGSVVQGGSVAPVATATLSSGTTQAVTFSATSSPALTGGSISFSPTSCNPTCTSIMTVTTAASTPSGAYTITITGTGGSLTRTTTYTLTVNAATLSCTISANPASGNAPLNDVDFTATVAGTAVGTINYTFYCNRNDTSTSVFPIPPNPNYDHKLDGTSTNPYTATNICDYAAIGSYAGKVIVEKGVLAAECKTTVTVNNNPPTATNLQRIDANCCSSNPAYFFSWVYADPDLNTESRFEFQADNNSGFGSAEVNRNITGLSNPSPTTNNQSVLLVLSPIADQLGYGSIIYYWRVRVYDSTGLNSGWVNGTSFTTPARHYPDPTFSWLPWLPSPAEQIQFSSSGSICYDQNPAGASCTNILDGGTSTYYWTFQPDATPPQHPETNPKTKFSTKGIKPVTLTITDGLGNACTATQNVNVRFPLPKWREVAP